MDLLEFCEEKVAHPRSIGYHDLFDHKHLGFDVDKGRAAFREDLSRVLARNGIVFEMDEDGVMVRMGLRS